jgi:hypothetical protein
MDSEQIQPNVIRKKHTEKRGGHVEVNGDVDSWCSFIACV